MRKVSIVFMAIMAGSVLDSGLCFAEDAPSSGDTVLGQWLTQGKDARIEIRKRKVEVKDGEEAGPALYDGKIIWLKDAVFDESDPEAGKPVRDRENPDESLRDRPVVGLDMLKGFKYAGENTWEGGTIYDPESGKTYKCVITWTKPAAAEGGEAEDADKAPEPEKLNVRGYMGIPAFGRTTVWTRYTPPKEKSDSKETEKASE